MIIRNFSFRLALMFFSTFFAHISFAENDHMKKEYQNPYLVKTFIDPVSGNQIDEIIVPPSPPPKFLPKGVELPVLKNVNDSQEQNIVYNVPRFTWCYGCSATSAAMMMGHYDNTSIFTNMYTGPTNGGVCPMINETWGQHVEGQLVGVRGLFVLDFEAHYPTSDGVGDTAATFRDIGERLLQKTRFMALVCTRLTQGGCRNERIEIPEIRE